MTEFAITPEKIVLALRAQHPLGFKRPDRWYGSAAFGGFAAGQCCGHAGAGSGNAARMALDETIRILGAERAFLFLLDESDDSSLGAGEKPVLVPYLGRDTSGHDVAELAGYSASLVHRVRDSGVAMVVTGTDEGAALGTKSRTLHGLRSIMVAPLQLNGRLLGVVYLDSQVAQGHFRS